MPPARPVGPSRFADRLKQRLGELARAAVERGVPPAWFGWRWVRHEGLREHIHRHGGPDSRYEVVHERSPARNPLPRNVRDRRVLPDDRGWWGYSFRDVPERETAETVLATLPGCRVVSYREPTRRDDFYPAILTRDDHALAMREIRFRARHAGVLRGSAPPVHFDRATWIIERVYHNHSHWLTAHLPKVVWLADRGELDDVLLPDERTRGMDASLRMLGLDPASFPTFPAGRILEIGRLRVLGTDRFRPELVQLVQRAYAAASSEAPRRRIYISRSKASRRRLVNEEEVWSLLEAYGFEQVWMEDLPFEEQVRLMQQTAVLVAPHGAGLTNMIFCQPGARVAEIADLSFPNPNFYALASALEHPYWLLEARPSGEGHPLERDMHVDVAKVAEVLPALVRV